jgi:hypothetical protein
MSKGSFIGIFYRIKKKIKINLLMHVYYNSIINSSNLSKLLKLNIFLFSTMRSTGFLLAALAVGIIVGGSIFTQQS